MELTKLDENLLELAALEVPWYMVCGEFHERYGSPGALARRLFELRDADLLTIRSRMSGELAITPEALEEDALLNACYEDVENIKEPEWDIVATDSGYELVKHRLAAQ